MSDSDKPKKDEDKTLIDADGEMVNSLMDEMSGSDDSVEEESSGVPVPPPIPVDADLGDEEDEATRAMEAPSFDDEEDEELAENLSATEDEDEDEDEELAETLNDAEEEKEEGGIEFDSDPGDPTLIAHAPTEADMELDSAEEDADLDDGGEKTMMLDLNAGAASIPRARFRVVFGNDRGEVFNFPPGTYTVGRHETADLTLNDPAVSRRHFNIVVSDTTSRVLDLGSGNGTKVDGSLATDALLVHGMQIEVGTSVVRYEDPMRPEDEFSVEGVPTGNKPPPKPAPVAAARPAPAPAPAPAAPRYQTAPANEGGLGWLIVVLLLVFVSGAFVAGEAIFGWYNVMGIGPDSAEDGSGAGGSEGRASTKKMEKAQDLFTKAQKAFEDEQWLNAEDYSERALTLNPDLKKARDLMTRAQSEQKSKKVISDAKLMGKDLNDQLRTRLEDITSTSVYYIPAKKLLTAASTPDEKTIVIALAEAISVRDIEGAEAQLELLHQHHPRSIKYLEFKRKIDKLKRKRTSSSVKSRPKVTSRPKVVRNDPAPVRRSTSGADLSPGLNYYAQGSYQRAIRFFREISSRENVDDRSREKAKRLATAVSKYESNYSGGKQALDRYDSSRAIQLLNSARKSDKELGGANKNAIHPLLARAYVMAAKDSFQNKQYGRARKYISKATVYDSTNASAQDLSRKIEPKARGLFKEALEARDDGDKARARRLLQDVMGMSRVGSTTYTKARNALSELR